VTIDTKILRKLSIISILLSFLLSVGSNAETILNSEEMTIKLNQNLSDGELYCLSSAEYDQIYLPDNLKCDDCTLDQRSDEIMNDGWRSEYILFVVRQEKSIEINKISIPDDLQDKVYTSYRDVAFFPEKFGLMTQCTADRTATAGCFYINDSCLFLFLNSEEN
jgi:hypothetical protein